MPFMSREELESEAERLHVNLEGLSWPQMQREVMDAQTKEKEEIKESYEEQGITYRSNKVMIPVEEYNRLLALEDKMQTPTQNSQVEKEDESLYGQLTGLVGAAKGMGRDCDGDDTEVIVNEVYESQQAQSHEPSDEVEEVVEEDTTTVKEVKEDLMEPMRGKRVMIAPEMAQTTTQLFGYDEDLGEEIAVEEEHYDVRDAVNFTRDMVTGTYKIKGKTGRHTIAQSAMPKEGCEITYRPDKDIVPIVTFQKRSGYLWTHHRLPNIKDLLKQSGYYEQYKDQFKDDPAIWHAAGKLLCCDISLTDHVLNEIQADAKRKLVENARTQDFLSK